MIEFKSVSHKVVNEFFSLYNFNCVINTHTLFVGDIFNGANSIMRTLSKVDNIYDGTILIDNTNIKKIKNKNLDLAYITEEPILFKHKNIFKNLYFPLKIRKINKKLAKNLINNVFFELKNKNFNIFNNFNLNLKAKKLSLSEQKILILLRAALRKPKIILLENFFENLDHHYHCIAEFIINKLCKESLIVACEKQMIDSYKFFNVIFL